MSTSVVRDQPIATPDEMARALHDVAAGRGETVQKYHGRPVAGLVAGQRDAACTGDLAQKP